MDGVVEIITSRERRRRWSLADKIRLVAETNEPGALIRAVAARHNVCESLLFTWRRQARDGLLGPVAPEPPMFVPVQALGSASAATMPVDEMSRAVVAPRPAIPSGLIESELGDDRQIRVGSDGNLAALRRGLAAWRA